MKVFVSYASEDRRQAEDIAVRLQQEDHEVYFDRSSLQPGEGYDEALRGFIDQADLLIFMISPDSVTRGSYTLTELKFATRRWPNPNGKILPVMAKKTPRDAMPSVLRAIGILEAEGNLSAEVIAEVDRLQTRRQNRRTVSLGAIAATMAVIAVAVVLRTHEPDPPEPHSLESDPAGASAEADAPVEVGGSVTRREPRIVKPDVDSCGDLRVLRGCEFDLARKICTAYAVLEEGDMQALAAGNAPLVSRAGNFLYTKRAKNQAAIQFLDNVAHAYQQSGGKGVRFAEIGDPRAFWIENQDASLVLSAVINASEFEIPDGESSIYYGKDVPLSIPFRVEGRQWGKTRNIHVAAFAYFSAIASVDADSSRGWMELALNRMTDVCRK